MKITEIITALRTHTGPVYVGVLARNSVIYVKAVKSDLIEMLASTTDFDYEIRTSVHSNALYIDCC